MLAPLRSKPSSSLPCDAFRMLLECHQWQRSFSELAFRAASLDWLPEQQRAEAFAAVERYFTVAWPLHVEDEDVSLGRRLRELELSEDLRRGLMEMERQHRELEVLMASLLPRWRLLGEQPGRHGELAAELLRDSGLLVLRMEDHLWLEERLLFPEARKQLSSDAVAAITAEMHARRGVRH